MATYFDRSPHFRNLTLNINLLKEYNKGSQRNMKKPEITSRDKFYKVYSPLKFKLKPRDYVFIDLKFNILTPETIQPSLNLLPSFKSAGLHIENDDWLSNKTRDGTIQIHILNRSFTYTIKVKNQCITYIFLLGEKSNDTINTIYNLLLRNCVIIPLKRL